MTEVTQIQSSNHRNVAQAILINTFQFTLLVIFRTSSSQLSWKAPCLKLQRIYIH